MSDETPSPVPATTTPAPADEAPLDLDSLPFFSAADAKKKPKEDKPDKAEKKAKAKANKEAASGGDDIFDVINKEFGDGTLVSLTAPPTIQYAVIPTGCLSLDNALGVGGLPRGRIVEIFGGESCGKTTLALQTVAQAMQLSKKRCAFIDAEHALDVTYARKLGVDLSRMMVSQPDYGEQALEICDRLVRSEQCDVIVVDSVAALIPKAELEGEMGDSHMGLQARLMSQACRKLVGSVRVSETLLVFINQTRMKIGVMWGSPETTTGGNALKFYASIRIKVVRTGTTKAGEVAVSNKTKATVVKNKCASPFREAEFEIEYGKGVSLSGEVLDYASDLKIVDKSGAWYSYAGERLGQGRENAKQCLETNPQLLGEILTKVRAKL